MLRKTMLGAFVSLSLGLVLAQAPAAFAQQAKVIKISHQFPGGAIDEGDFRDRLVRKSAQEVEQKSGGQLKFEIYPASSLMKAVPQFKGMSTGALDMAL